MLVGLSASNILAELINNNVKKFIQRFVHQGKKTKEIVETRMRQYKEIKTKTTETFLPDSNNLTHYIKRVTNLLLKLIIGCTA